MDHEYESVYDSGSNAFELADRPYYYLPVQKGSAFMLERTRKHD